MKFGSRSGGKGFYNKYIYVWFFENFLLILCRGGLNVKWFYCLWGNWFMFVFVGGRNYVGRGGVILLFYGLF